MSVFVRGYSRTARRVWRTIHWRHSLWHRDDLPRAILLYASCRRLDSATLLHLRQFLTPSSSSILSISSDEPSDFRRGRFTLMLLRSNTSVVSRLGPDGQQSFHSVWHSTGLTVKRCQPCLSPVSIQTQALALASSQSWLPLLRPSIPIGWRLRLLRENFTQQMQAPANRNARSKQWQSWLAACQRKRLCFLRFSFTQRTQRKRLRLNGNWAWP